MQDMNKYTDNTVQLVQCRQEYRFEQKLHLVLLFLYWMKAPEMHQCETKRRLKGLNILMLCRSVSHILKSPKNEPHFYKKCIYMYLGCFKTLSQFQSKLNF